MSIAALNRQKLSTENRARCFVEKSLGENIQNAVVKVITGLNKDIEIMEKNGLTSCVSKTWNIQREDLSNIFFYHTGPRNLENTLFRNYYQTYVDYTGQDVPEMVYQEKCYRIAAEKLQQSLSDIFSKSEFYTIETQVKLQGCFAGRFKRLPYTLTTLLIPILGWSFFACDSGLYSGKIQFKFYITRKDVSQTSSLRLVNSTDSAEG